jgi:hypothetical protein
MLKTKRTIAPDDPRVPDAERFAERLRRAVAETPRDQPVPEAERISGADANDAVICYVDVLGEFVDLDVRSDWWYTVGPGGIASAVLDALVFAQEKSLIALAVLAHDGRTPTSRFTFPQNERGPAYPADPESEIAEARAAIRRGAALVDAADRLARMRDTARPRTIAGPRGLFRITMAGFELVQADVNEGALSASDSDALADDARQALAQATREKDPRYWFEREVPR